MEKLIQIIVLLVLAWLLGTLTVEGTVRLPGLHRTFTEARFGRVALGVATFRPGRVYYKLAMI